MKTRVSEPSEPSSADLAFVPLVADHLEDCVALSRAEGWSHRREDWAMLLPLSRGVAALNGGRVVGTTLRTDFGDALSTVNMIIVEQGFRSRGVGRKLMTMAIGGSRRSLRLIATASGRPLYEKLGFEAVGNIACAQGVVTGFAPSDGVRDASSGDVAEISHLESASFGGDRSALVEWFRNNARIAVLPRAGSIRGFAAARRFGDGHVIGPVVASNPEDGLALIAHLARDLYGRLVRLDVTEASGLQEGLCGLGLEVCYQAPIMQRGAVSATPQRLALVSQALA